MDRRDVCELVRRDHDDMDRAFSLMVDPSTTPKELSNLLEILRLALAVHTAAEAKVLELLVTRMNGPRALGMLVTQTRLEHVAQRAGVDALTRIRPASIAWYEYALELRVLVLDHAGRADQLRWTLEDHVPRELHRVLGSEYATERLRVLGSTSPMIVAQCRDAALAPN
jgi:hypothetical protein